MTSAKRPRPGHKILIFGGQGTGKTCSLLTMLTKRAQEILPIKVVYIYSDPNGIVALEHTAHKLNKTQDAGISLEKSLIDIYIEESDGDWDSLESFLSPTVGMDYEKISAMDYASSKNQLASNYMNFISTMCRTKINGFYIRNLPIYEYWVVYDGLSNINRLAYEMAVGAKPVLHKGEWNVGQKMAQTLVKPFVTGKCNFTLLAHEEQENEEITGRLQLTVSALGKKGANLITTLGFGEILHSATSISPKTKKLRYIWQFGERAENCFTRTNILENTEGSVVLASYIPYLEHLRRQIEKPEELFSPVPEQDKEETGS